MPKNLMRKPLQGYFLDQAELKAEPWKPLYDSYHYSLATEMEERRQKIACLDSILEKERHRHTAKMGTFQERWENAAESMKAADESVVKFDDHYREGIIQRERFLRLAARQDELRDLKLRDLKQLQHEKTLMEEIREQTAKRLNRFKPVATYLEKVLEDSQGEFKSIRELLDRFTLLSETRMGLMERDEHARNLVGRRTKQVADLAVIKSNERVLLSNDIFEIREGLEILKNQEERLDEDLLHIQTTAAQRAMTLGQVRISTYNLYQQVCRRMNRPAKIPANDTIKQLHYIQSSMKEMSKLIRQVHSILKSAREETERERLAEEREAEKARKKAYRDPRKKHRNDDMRGIFGFPPKEGKEPGGGGHGQMDESGMSKADPAKSMINKTLTPSV